MKKKGQMVIFIVLGLVVLVIFGIVWFAKASVANKSTEKQVEKAGQIAYEIEPLKKYAEACLKIASERGLWILGENGGYISIDADPDYGETGTTNFLTYDGRKVPLYYSNGDMYPNLDQIKARLERYILVEFQKCLQLNDFSEQGLTIKRPDINFSKANFILDGLNVSSDVSINVDSVTVSVIYPMKARKKEYEASISEFRVYLPVRLGRIYNISADNTIGVLGIVKQKWNSGQQFQIGADIHCEAIYDSTGKINIYSSRGEDADRMRIIRVIDYSTYDNRFLKSYLFEWAIYKDAPINIDEGGCAP